MSRRCTYNVGTPSGPCMGYQHQFALDPIAPFKPIPESIQEHDDHMQLSPCHTVSDGLVASPETGLEGDL